MQASYKKLQIPSHSPVKISLDDMLGLRNAADTMIIRKMRAHAGVSGGYTSVFRGRGMEFEETRPYVEGDDIRTLDWKVTARTNKPHTKVYIEERERPIQVCVDLRANMFFATKGVFKSVLVSQIAALIAWVSLRHRDRLGGLLFSDTHHDEIKPKSGRRAVFQYLRTLVSHQAWEHALGAEQQPHQETLNHALTRLRRVVRPGSLIFLLSDFRGLDKVGEAHLHELSRRNEIVLVFSYDDLEKQIPAAGVYNVTNGSREVVFNGYSKSSRALYRERFNKHLAHIERIAAIKGIFLTSCTTDENPAEFLQLALSQGIPLCRT